MSDANESVPPLLQSEDSEPINPFAEMCNESLEMHVNKPKVERETRGAASSDGGNMTKVRAVRNRLGSRTT
eukprot:9654446-Karenia_brevis.AAC.1